MSKKIEPANQQQRNERARAFAIEAARLAGNTRCHKVVVLDVKDISPVCDFFVIASGTSARQMRSVADEIIELGKTLDHAAIHHDGYDGESWVLVDFADVIVHLFSDEARTYYDLDSLWADAVSVDVPAN